MACLSDGDLGGPHGCAASAMQLGGEPAGSATLMTSWLLLEQPGPWPAEAAESVFARLLGHERLAGLREAGLRPLLIRKPGRHPRTGGTRVRVFLGSGRVGNRWLERLEFDDPAELGDLDLEAVAHGTSGHGEAVRGPLFLVCTHAAKDMCCAVLGRPIAATLADEYPDQTWEVSHVGGDRWAGNLLVAPDGHLHGQLDPSKAILVAKAAVAGQVHPDHLRGRTCTAPGWEQFAEIAVRKHTGVTGVDAVNVLAQRIAETPDERTLVVAAHDQRYEVTVHREQSHTPQRNRCTSGLTLTTYRATALHGCP